MSSVPPRVSPHKHKRAAWLCHRAKASSSTSSRTTRSPQPPRRLLSSFAASRPSPSGTSTTSQHAPPRQEFETSDTDQPDDGHDHAIDDLLHLLSFTESELVVEAATLHHGFSRRALPCGDVPQRRLCHLRCHRCFRKRGVICRLRAVDYSVHKIWEMNNIGLSLLPPASLSNSPYHVGFSTPYTFLAGSFLEAKRLLMAGRRWMAPLDADCHDIVPILVPQFLRWVADYGKLVTVGARSNLKVPDERHHAQPPPAGSLPWRLKLSARRPWSQDCMAVHVLAEASDDFD
uniref:Uncharacterized protein n=1 Tax=Zea mays TaxID=4577 RepID=A0A804NA53_MAIZE